MEIIEKKLDVKLNSELETSCPQFVQLLQRLSEKLDSCGRSKKSQEQFDQIQEKTETARKKFLAANVRLAILKELILSKSVETTLLNEKIIFKTFSQVSNQSRVKPQP